MFWVIFLVKPSSSHCEGLRTTAFLVLTGLAEPGCAWETGHSMRKGLQRSTLEAFLKSN